MTYLKLYEVAPWVLFARRFPCPFTTENVTLWRQVLYGGTSLPMDARKCSKTWAFRYIPVLLKRAFKFIWAETIWCWACYCHWIQLDWVFTRNVPAHMFAPNFCNRFSTAWMYLSASDPMIPNDSTWVAWSGLLIAYITFHRLPNSGRLTAESLGYAAPSSTPSGRHRGNSDVFAAWFGGLGWSRCEADQVCWLIGYDGRAMSKEWWIPWYSQEYAWPSWEGCEGAPHFFGKTTRDLLAWHDHVSPSEACHSE